MTTRQSTVLRRTADVVEDVNDLGYHVADVDHVDNDDSIRVTVTVDVPLDEDLPVSDTTTDTQPVLQDTEPVDDGQDDVDDYGPEPADPEEVHDSIVDYQPSKIHEQFEDVDGIGTAIADRLQENGYETPRAVLEADVDVLAEIPYVSAEKAQLAKDVIQETGADEDQSEPDQNDDQEDVDDLEAPIDEADIPDGAEDASTKYQAEPAEETATDGAGDRAVDDLGGAAYGGSYGGDR